MTTWMIYGANGYTGRLTAELAVSRGHRPVLAGRSAGPVAALATRLELEYRVFDLDHIGSGMDGVDVVAHCAGPFRHTARPMVDACLATGTHYLDITGEVGVLEDVYTRHDEAVAAGVVLLPGAGFDVVPTDCLAVIAAGALPGAVELVIAFSSGSSTSPGTTKTLLEGSDVRRRVNGTLTGAAPPPCRVRFPSGSRWCVPIPWGDLASAYRSTGVPTISTYVRVSPGMLVTAPVLLAASRSPVGRRWARSLIDAAVRGPDERGRARSVSEVCVRAVAADGTAVSVRMTGPNGYSLTADSVIRAVDRVGGVPAGAHTPSTAFGSGYVSELDGVTVGRVEND